MTRQAVVGDLLRARAADLPDALFVECDGVRRTYGEMLTRAERLAASLASVGVTKGDRVATILPNTIEHVDLIFACALLGAIHVPVNVFLKGEFLAYQLIDAGVSVVVVDDPGRDAVDKVRGHIGQMRDVLHVANLPDGDEVPEVVLEPSDTLAIVYTSGTTGMPKGCMLPHGYHAQGTASGRDMLGYCEGDVLYTANPLFHGWARGMLFGALVHRMTAVIDRDFSATTVLRRFAETGATVFSGVGAMGMAMLATDPSDDDRAHNLRVAFMIPFAPDAQRAFTERFGAVVQSQMYGQTETGAITFSSLGNDSKLHGVGTASPSYDVRVVDDNDADVPSGWAGEVVVRPKETDVMYSGYWAKPEETAEAMRGGWHHTGDLARFDRDGYLTFVDRKKDAVRRRGENVSSVQLEQAILAHPKITEAAIVAVPSEMTDDDIKACLVLSGETSPEELFGFFRESLPYFAIPRYVEILEQLPKTATMRVQKHLLRARGANSATWDLQQLGLAVDRDDRR